MAGREHIVWVPDRGGGEGIFTILNFCILIAKYRMYCQRIHNENLIEFKNKLITERYICISTATIDKFDKFQILY